MNQSSLSYHIHGSEQQYLEVCLPPEKSVMAETTSVMMFDDGIEILKTSGKKTRKRTNFLNKAIDTGIRILRRENLYLSSFSNETSTNKRILFTPTYPGKIIQIDLNAFDGEFFCQKDSFLAASEDVFVGIEASRSSENNFFVKKGLLMRKLTGSGVAFLSAGGGFFKKKLEENESVYISIASLVGFSKDVDVQIEYIGEEKKSIFGGDSFLMIKLKGPGTIFTQLLSIDRFEQVFLSFINQNEPKKR